MVIFARGGGEGHGGGGGGWDRWGSRLSSAPHAAAAAIGSAGGAVPFSATGPRALSFKEGGARRAAES